MNLVSEIPSQNIILCSSICIVNPSTFLRFPVVFVHSSTTQEWEWDGVGPFSAFNRS
jgi:hypothetical protein